jgi:hypothetical protein
MRRVQSRPCVARLAPIEYLKRVWRKAALVFGPIASIVMLNAVARVSAWVTEPAAADAPEPEAPEDPPEPPEDAADEPEDNWEATVDLSDLTFFARDHGDIKMVIAGNNTHGRRHCEPNAAVWVAGNNNELEFDGECGQIQVTGNGNDLTAEHADHVKVSGNNNELRVVETQSVALLGNGNEVRYETSLQGQAPTLLQTGKNNELIREEPGEPEPEHEGAP